MTVPFRTFTTEHGQFRIQARDRLFGRGAGVAETKFARHFLSSPREKVLVIGAHVGTVAIPLSLHCREVVAIEANPETFMMLEHNITAHDRSNIRALWLAASDSFSEIEFVMSSVNTGGSKRMPAFRDHDFFYDKPKETTVPAGPLDDVVGKFGPFDLIFMDCEGSEYHAMLGMPKILSHAETVIAEFFPRHLSRVAAIEPAQFLEPLCAFHYALIPSQNKFLTRYEIKPFLQKMCDKNQNDGGVVFAKHAGRIMKMQEQMQRCRPLRL